MSYRLTSYEAEIMWAAAWLYKATGEARFLNDAEFQYNNFDIGKEQSNTFFYEKILVGIQVLHSNIFYINFCKTLIILKIYFNTDRAHSAISFIIVLKENLSIKNLLFNLLYVHFHSCRITGEKI